ncbi:Legume-like lectin family protein [Trichomonas vaginalis G3]|uniref:Legume-like lectin family protein n=1 Tax=Trichomonas vaginalis (strain ATCC PRA-98 / G3) TaxID=412133 RepID=A2ESU3_TRIV3|nr:lectin leg-like domain-containing protein [Trichomonas vaginalis G3]EAY04269.1 Legume-like lectin family protein [Trichomonas vaginalis G3]KAI5549362.1 lectin leg-like domain-containing protein [Trichomonas vaginalis G3]|eukprot:XP_001316492.1 Legume-like lectin family protein [Trichomonas vaginalis G3]
MFSLFSLCLVQDLESYNLNPPFKLTGLTEIGDWSVIGSAAIIKKYIRLTSAVTEVEGGVCHRKPTQFENWTVDFTLKGYNGNGGAGFNFTYSYDFCPENNEDATGFTLFINTTTRYSLCPIYIIEGRHLKSMNSQAPIDMEKAKIGDFDFRGEEPINIRITRAGNLISLKFIRGYYITNFEREIQNLPSVGYFSIKSYTTKWADDNDLLDFKVTQLSGDIPLANANISEINKKVLDLSKNTRRAKKLVRKFQSLITGKYDRARRSNSNQLTGNKQEFSEITNVINELITRATQTVSKENLKEFILNDVEETLAKAAAKMQIQMDRYKETEFDMNDIWSDLKGNLRDLAMEAKLNMTMLGEEAIKLANKIVANNFTAEEMEIEDLPAGEEKSFIPTFCILFCICEFVVYILWFNNKRRRTNNFKKAD